MIIARHLIDQLIAQAIAEAPRECCGMIGTRDGEAVRVYPATNAAGSETRYEIDGVEQMTILEDIAEDGLELGAIYHSHTHGSPFPSLTDIKTAFYPDVLYLIIGALDWVDWNRLEPQVRAFSIRDELSVTERALEIR